MIYKELLKTPRYCDTIEKKLQWLDEEIVREKNLDRIEQSYSLQLRITKEYWNNKIKQDGKKHMA